MEEENYLTTEPCLFTHVSTSNVDPLAQKKSASLETHAEIEAGLVSPASLTSIEVNKAGHVVCGLIHFDFNASHQGSL